MIAVSEFILRPLDVVMEKLWYFLHLRKQYVVYALCVVWFATFAIFGNEEMSAWVTLYLFLMVGNAWFQWRESKRSAELQNAIVMRIRSCRYLAIFRVIMTVLVLFVFMPQVYPIFFLLVHLVRETYVSQIPPKKWKMPSLTPKVAHARI